tara:strand:+ start:1598 stop:2098 length:501 start_codon:yes stop_codon:yes gene_type:complete
LKYSRENFNEIVNEHGSSIYRVCKAYCGAGEELDDVYQETLINIWKSIQRFRGESKLSTWIYRITVNTAITHRRKSQRQVSGSSELLDSIEFDSSDTIFKQEREHQYGLMLRAIERLKPDQRMIIGLYLEDLSYKEIADVIGRDTNYVGVNITRIKERLSKMMQNG